METDAEYVVYMDDVNIGDMTTNLSGKLSVSAEAEAGKEIEIKVVRKNNGKKQRRVYISVRIVDMREASGSDQCPMCKEWNTFVEEKGGVLR